MAPRHHTLREHLLSGLVVALAVALYVTLREPIGEVAAIVSVLPVATVSTIYGTRAGIITSAAAFPFNTFLLEGLIADDPVGVTPVFSLISISLFGVAWLFGRFPALFAELGLAEEGQAKAERALRANEERLRNLLRAFPDVVFRFDPAGRLIELYGEDNLSLDLRKEQYLFRPLDVLFSKETATAIMREAALVRDVRREFTVNEDRDGAPRPMQIVLCPDQGNDILGIARDITGRKAAPGG